MKTHNTLFPPNVWALRLCDVSYERNGEETSEKHKFKRLQREKREQQDIHFTELLNEA